MSKVKFFTFSTWGLLALNIAILAFFSFGRPGGPPPNHAGPDFQSKVVKLLKLNDTQEASFIKLAHQHNDRMTELNEKQSGLLLNYFGSLTDTNQADDSDVGLEPMQELQNDKLRITYEHLLDIKKLLNKDQLIHFDNFMNEFTQKIVMHHNNQRPPPPR